VLTGIFDIHQFKRTCQLLAVLFQVLLITATTGYGQYAVERDKLVASDRRALSHFGYAASISDRYAIIGTFSSAYIFEEQMGGTWKEVIKLFNPEREQAGFGRSLFIHGRYAFVGASALDHTMPDGSLVTDAGGVFIYYRNESGKWILSEKIIAPDPQPSAFFGYSISASDNVLAIGAYGDSKDAQGGDPLEGAGAVFLFTLNENGKWVQAQKIVPADRTASLFFGKSLAVTDDDLLVGASAQGTDPIPFSGCVYYFSKGSGNVWSQAQKIIAPSPEQYKGFGRALQVFQRSAVISNESEKAAHIFQKDSTGVWKFTDALASTGTSVHNLFGGSVSISEKFAVVGAAWQDEQKQGAAYIYMRTDSGNWVILEKVVAPIRSSGDEFGYAVGLSNNKLIVGSFLDEKDESGENLLERAGSAYIFELHIPGAAVIQPPPPPPVENCLPFTRDFIIPNVITPNGDAKNECFMIRDLYDRTSLFVSDRYGYEVYRNDNYSNNWCGGTLGPGIYYWTIVQYDKHCFERVKGWLHILR
jgi:gliding motility-associated-like protein